MAPPNTESDAAAPVGSTAGVPPDSAYTCSDLSLYRKAIRAAPTAATRASIGTMASVRGESPPGPRTRITWAGPPLTTQTTKGGPAGVGVGAAGVERVGEAERDGELPVPAAP